jgi:hypothetical protein
VGFKAEKKVKFSQKPVEFWTELGYWANIDTKGDFYEKITSLFFNSFGNQPFRQCPYILREPASDTSPGAASAASTAAAPTASTSPAAASS